MNIPSVNNPYALLALFLSPWKNQATLIRLTDIIRQDKVDWGRLLHMANLHFCAPLWFVRMKQDALLPLLPAELQTYMEYMYQANTERQEFFRQAAIEVVSNLQELNISVILLKGAATFCDDLYEDIGARMMGDLDFLVQKQHIHPVKNLLEGLGYRQQEDCFGTSGHYNSSLPHHLPRFLKSGTPVAVEIHFQTAKGHANRVLPTEVSWANKEGKSWEGFLPWVLTPTYRLLHNTVHALIPNEAFATSNISLSHLAEFAHLARRYDLNIDWREWLERGDRQGLGRQFSVYLTLADRLMGMPFPRVATTVGYAGMHVARISSAANNRAAYLLGDETPPEAVKDRIKALAVRCYIAAFRRLNRPVWAWRNLFYRPGFVHLPLRFFWLLVFLLRRNNLIKIFDIRAIFRKVNKIGLLIKRPET